MLIWRSWLQQQPINYDRFAGVKKRERNSRSPNTPPISLNEKNGINAMAKTIIV